MNNNLIVLGGGESGVGTAYLASQNGINVFFCLIKILLN
jgi:glycerol-3-phosphate dehydrogenase